MPFAIGVVIIVTAFVSLLRLRAPGRLDAARLGWMSEQWLAERRAAYRS